MLNNILNEIQNVAEIFNDEGNRAYTFKDATALIKENVSIEAYTELYSLIALMFLGESTYTGYDIHSIISAVVMDSSS